MRGKVGVKMLETLEVEDVVVVEGVVKELDGFGNLELGAGRGEGGGGGRTLCRRWRKSKNIVFFLALDEIWAGMVGMEIGR